MTQAKVTLKLKSMKHTLQNPPKDSQWFEYKLYGTQYIGVVSDDNEFMVRMTEDGRVYVTDMKNFRDTNAGAGTELERINVEIKVI